MSREFFAPTLQPMMQTPLYVHPDWMTPNRFGSAG
jgi:hypothetical protein